MSVLAFGDIGTPRARSWVESVLILNHLRTDNCLNSNNQGVLVITLSKKYTELSFVNKVLFLIFYQFLWAINNLKYMSGKPKIKKWNRKYLENLICISQDIIKHISVNQYKYFYNSYRKISHDLFKIHFCWFDYPWRWKEDRG